MIWRSRFSSGSRGFDKRCGSDFLEFRDYKLDLKTNVRIEAVDKAWPHPSLRSAYTVSQLVVSWRQEVDETESLLHSIYRAGRLPMEEYCYNIIALPCQLPGVE